MVGGGSSYRWSRACRLWGCVTSFFFPLPSSRCIGLLGRRSKLDDGWGVSSMRGFSCCGQAVHGTLRIQVTPVLYAVCYVFYCISASFNLAVEYCSDSENFRFTILICCPPARPPAGGSGLTTATYMDGGETRRDSRLSRGNNPPVSQSVLVSHETGRETLD